MKSINEVIRETFPFNPWWWLRLWVKRVLRRWFLLVEYCDACGVQQPVIWYATDELWESLGLMSNGIFCPYCFDKIASKQHILIRWTPTVEQKDGE